MFNLEVAGRPPAKPLGNYPSSDSKRLERFYYAQIPQTDRSGECPDFFNFLNTAVKAQEKRSGDYISDTELSPSHEKPILIRCAAI